MTNHSQEKPKSTSGLIRNQPESPVENFCLSMPRSRSCSSGSDVHNLGQVGTPVRLYPVRFDFEGFNETERNSIQECSLDNTRPADTLVLESINQEPQLGDF